MSDATLEPPWGRDQHDDPATMIMVRRVQPAEPLSFRALFVQHYAAIRRLCLGFPHPGVLVVALEVHGGRLEGSLTVAASPDEVGSVIVGRHSRADLLLRSDPVLSLRHLAVVLGPACDDELRLRLIDLRTQSGFEDEHGRRYESLVSDGSLFVRCGDHALFFLRTSAHASWPEHAAEAWAQLPPRVYVEAEPAEPGRAWPPPPGADVTLAAARERRRRSAGESTLVHRIRGPVVARRCMLAPDEEPVGTLRVVGQGGAQALVVGEQALSRGVLLGRYPRCDLDGESLVVDESVSRVHLLVLAIDDELHAIDTASRNGTMVCGQAEPLRIAPLLPGRELSLAHGTTVVRWEPA